MTTDAAHTLTGDIRLHERFRSRFLRTRRHVIVYLPPDYEASRPRRHPVLYMHDGQNLFDSATAFGNHEWEMDETADTLIRAGAIEPLIIVGVYNAGAHRVSEYTPTPDAARVGGQADLHGRMLVEELRPFINRRYRTRLGAQHTGLGGSSLGGLAALYLGLRYPEVFGKLAALSPSVWWDEAFIVRYVQLLHAKPAVRIWLSTGTEESRQSTRLARRLRAALIAKGWRAGEDLAYHEAKGEQHHERAWAKLVGPMLRFLYPAR